MAECVKTFAADNGIDLARVDVVGFHGQTVLHRPERGLTVQLGDGAALSAALGVPVVYDFRAADMEKGGQGAPLVPIFHWALAFHEKLEPPAAFVNIGGIANVTYVPDGAPEGLIAFDAGAGNCLLDDWAMKHIGEPLREGLAPRFSRDSKPAGACSASVSSLLQRAATKIPGSGRVRFGCARRFERRRRRGYARGLHRCGHRRRRALFPCKTRNLDHLGRRHA